MTAPLLAYPDFKKPFTLGLDTILSQIQDDGKLYLCQPSIILSQSENYAINELETLAIVWAVTHFCYLHMTMKLLQNTDHAAAKALPGTLKSEW